MTELLYNKDAYIKEFDSIVISCEEMTYDKKKAYAIILESTCFFPEQGGQDSDLGELIADEASKVLHVSIKDNVITHVCSKELKAGIKVHGKIDWEHRFDLMQQHSGEHLVSGTVHKLFGYENVGFHLSTREVTLDFNGTFEDSEIQNIENIVNKAIYENFETHIFFPSKDELSRLEYRSKKEILGDVRIVEYPGYDICACCAPHVHRTGEIGMIKIAAYEHFKGGTRVWIRCGSRALSYFDQVLDSAKAISRINSVKIEDISGAVEKLVSTVKDLRYNNIKLERDLLEIYSKAALTDKVPAVFVESCDADSARETVNSMAAASDNYCFVFIGNDEKGYRFLLGSDKKDCRQMLASMKEVFTIKGGGSESLIQGNISASQTEIKEFLAK